jgi:hypothetical protein
LLLEQEGLFARAYAQTLVSKTAVTLSFSAY